MDARFAQGAGLGQIHHKFRHPIVVFFRVNEHLLHTPGFFVFADGYVRMPRIAGVRLQADALVFHMICLNRLREAGGGPGFNGIRIWLGGGG